MCPPARLRRAFGATEQSSKPETSYSLFPGLHSILLPPFSQLVLVHHLSPSLERADEIQSVLPHGGNRVLKPNCSCRCHHRSGARHHQVPNIVTILFHDGSVALIRIGLHVDGETTDLREIIQVLMPPRKRRTQRSSQAMERSLARRSMCRDVNKPSCGKHGVRMLMTTGRS
jgi:hypothetical protein